MYRQCSLRWPSDECRGVSNHWPFHLLFNSLLMPTSKGTSNLLIFCLLLGKSTGGFPRKGPITRKRLHSVMMHIAMSHRTHPTTPPERWLDGLGVLTHAGYGWSPPGTIFKMAIWASEILKSIKSELHLELVYCSHSTTHFLT